MRWKPRVLAKTILKASKTFPAIVLTGPRQSGKTTLFRILFSKSHRFVTLEDLDTRMKAKEDPRAFLNHYAPPVIIDEIQYVPELLPYIKTKIDENRKAGNWLFTGSQNFVLMKNVSESLAGRSAVLSLMPFSYMEKISLGDDCKDMRKDWQGFLKRTPSGGALLTPKNIPLSEWLLRGGYPELASQRKVDRQLWCGSYITTYLERDIRNLASIGDLGQFENFLRLCATRTGQILNLADMARDLGVSMPTAKRWLSILETGYQVYLLYPYYKNIGKRLVKSPKLYFTDTALATYLLGIHDAQVLLNGASFGSLFETMVIGDVLKRFLHCGKRPSMYYLRTRDDLEVDLVVEIGGKLHLFEIKSAMTISSKHASSLRRLREELGSEVTTTAVISRSPDNAPIVGGIMNWNWRDWLVY